MHQRLCRWAPPLSWRDSDASDHSLSGAYEWPGTQQVGVKGPYQDPCMVAKDSVCCVQSNWGTCGSACPAVPVQEIYRMQFYRQTPSNILKS